MHIKYGKNKSLIELENSIISKIEKAKNKAELLCLGKSTQFPSGKLKGRWGKILSISFDENCGLLIQMAPFAITGKSVNRIIFVRKETHRLSSIMIFSDYVSSDMIRKGGK